MVNEIKHPLIEHKLSILRDKRTGTKEFRELASEIATILCYEAMKDAKLEEVEIETPLQKIKTGKIDENKYAFVPILRAGMGMTQGIENLIPNAKIGISNQRRFAMPIIIPTANMQTYVTNIKQAVFLLHL